MAPLFTIKYIKLFKKKCKDANLFFFFFKLSGRVHFIHE